MRVRCVVISKVVPQGTAEAAVTTTGLEEFYNYVDWRFYDIQQQRSKGT